MTLADGAGTRGMEVLDTGGKRDTAPAVDAAAPFGCHGMADGVGRRGMVVPDADGKKGTVPVVVLVGTEKGCTCAVAEDRAAAGGRRIGCGNGTFCRPRWGMRVIACWTAF